MRFFQIRIKIKIQHLYGRFRHSLVCAGSRRNYAKMIKKLFYKSSYYINFLVVTLLFVPIAGIVMFDTVFFYMLFGLSFVVLLLTALKNERIRTFIKFWAWISLFNSALVFFVLYRFNFLFFQFRLAGFRISRSIVLSDIWICKICVYVR